MPAAGSAMIEMPGTPDAGSYSMTPEATTELRSAPPARSARIVAGVVLVVLVFTWHTVGAAALGSVAYDAAHDELVVEIIYRGTHPDHEFSLDWAQCRRRGDGNPPYQAAARLIDAHGRDVAREDYRVTRRFDLSSLECRPALVTVRLGPTANRTVYLPEAPRG